MFSTESFIFFILLILLTMKGIVLKMNKERVYHLQSYFRVL